MTRLSETQLEALRSICTGRDAESMPPSGLPLSRWRRTRSSLADRGLVEQLPDTDELVLTQAGREELSADARPAFVRRGEIWVATGPWQ